MFTTGACSKNERGIYLQCDRSADEQGSGGKAVPVATLKYLYRKDGMIVGRVVDGKYQMYKYDKRGQLLQVADMQGNVAEKYVYDPAGNILSKTIAGKTTSYTYDKANQLVSSVCDGKTTHYEYDAAGRMVKEGGKSYEYGWLDKVLAVRENDKNIASFDYQVDGQIAQAIHGDQSEAFFWDGLALIHRGETSFINEPYVTGGNPILSSKQGVMFNDMLGSTLNIGGKAIHMTAFGESSDTNAMFTGEPYIGELGYAFLFRNYRADQGKWQTTDPLGYPDGWNNLAYGNNQITDGFDYLGGKWGNLDFVTYYFRSNGSTSDYVDISQMDLVLDVYNKIVDTVFDQVKNEIDVEVRAKIISQGGESGTINGSYTKTQGVSCKDICFAMGGGSVFFSLTYSGSYSPFTDFSTGEKYYIYSWTASGKFEYFDTFKDPPDLGNWWEKDIEIPGGTPYNYGHIWETASQIKVQGGLIRRPE